MSSILPSHIITHFTDCHDEGVISGGLAAVKVQQAYSLYAASRGLPIVGAPAVVGAKAFDTIDVGGKAADFYQSVRMHPAGGQNPVRQLIGINAAPPKSDEVGQPNNERENMVVGELRDGTVIAGTIKGYSLSYLKDEIKTLFEVTNTHDVLRDLYGDFAHDGMRQFRSHYLITHLLLDAALDQLDVYDLAALDPQADVPDPLAYSHAFTIDNFRNVKLWLSPEDQQRFDEAFAQVDEDRDVPCTFAFAQASGEVRKPSFGEEFEGILTRTMFEKPVGTNVVSLQSSSKHGGRRIPQICTLQSRAHAHVGFELPEVGASLKIDFKAPVQARRKPAVFAS